MESVLNFPTEQIIFLAAERFAVCLPKSKTAIAFELVAGRMAVRNLGRDRFIGMLASSGQVGKRWQYVSITAFVTNADHTLLIFDLPWLKNVFFTDPSPTFSR